MDLLKAEIANKRKAADMAGAASTSLSTAANAAAPLPAPNKYMRRRDLEKLREQQQRSASPSSSAASSSTPLKRLKSTIQSDPESPRLASPSTLSGLSAATKAALDTAAGQVEREKFNVSNDEAVRRLRAKGEPIRLFGESDKERRLRLRALELIEEKGGGALGHNDFRNALQSAQSATELELLDKRNAACKGKAEQAKLQGTHLKAHATNTTTGDTLTNERGTPSDWADSVEAQDESAAASSSSSKIREGVGMNSLLDLNLIKTDLDRVYPIIYYTLKDLLSEWATSLASRPDQVKHTMQGKLAAATQVQSSDYLKPLFKKLRKRSLTPDVTLLGLLELQW
uniref:Pre-mRNA-splicing factor 18 n=1 Tax=Melanopsichium pennsylvanicum 4 TaxID=1398559 RepID=A0A077R3X0_9BASI|nr:related to pre-mrna splicing factor 18 [Melanopsichium pennsylvanicum 4]